MLYINLSDDIVLSQHNFSLIMPVPVIRRSHMAKEKRIPHALSDLFRYRLAAS